MKKIFSIMLACLLVASMLVGCGGGSGSTTEAAKTEEAKTEAAKTEAAKTEEAKTEEAKTEGEGGKSEFAGTTIEIELSWMDERLNTLKATVIEPFIEETGINIDLITPGLDYETVMKTRMGANDLPDIWETHGWSIQRYKEYLLPLNDYDWIEDAMTDTAYGVIRDTDGKFYCLMINAGCTGIMFNRDTCAACGVDPYNLRTIAQWEEAMQKAIDNGYIGCYVGGNDTGNMGGFLNVVFPSLQTDVGCANNQKEALLNGTYDWDTDGREPFELIADWTQRGFFNPNVLTATTEEAQTALGKGEAMFIVRGIDNMQMAREYVPGCNVGCAPSPNSGTGNPTFKVGEGFTYAIWKDTKNLGACLEWMKYVIRPEVAQKIGEAGGAATMTIKGAKLENNYIFDEWEYTHEVMGQENIAYDNIFDRKYFPSGMWGTMGDACGYAFGDPTENGVKKAVECMKEQYEILMNPEE